MPWWINPSLTRKSQTRAAGINLSTSNSPQPCKNSVYQTFIPRLPALTRRLQNPQNQENTPRTESATTTTHTSTPPAHQSGSVADHQHTHDFRHTKFTRAFGSQIVTPCGGDFNLTESSKPCRSTLQMSTCIFVTQGKMSHSIQEILRVFESMP